MGSCISQLIHSTTYQQYTKLAEKNSVTTGNAAGKAIHLPCLQNKSGLAILISEKDSWYSSVLNWKSRDRRTASFKITPVKYATVPEIPEKKEYPFYKELHQNAKKYDTALNDLDTEEFFHILKFEDDAEVSHALYGGNSHEILVTHEPSNIEISRGLLQCLRPKSWLNDDIINLYLVLLKERETRERKKYPTCHFFNTFFYKKLTSGKNGFDFAAVRRWTAKKKLGYTLTECDKVFVPIHKHAHWCLAIINIKFKTFQYLDSFGGIDDHVLSVLGRYLVEETRDKGGEEIDSTFWKIEEINDLPLQNNGWDCGMFMLKYIDFCSRDLKLRFSQKHMNYFRKKTAMEILRLKVE